MCERGTIDVHGGMHRLVGVGSGSVANQGHMVSQFHSDAACGLNAGISQQSNEDDLFVTVVP